MSEAAKVIASVSITVADGSSNLISLSAWIARPSNEKIELILSNKVTFVDFDGNVVPIVQAIKLIKGDAS